MTKTSRHLKLFWPILCVMFYQAALGTARLGTGGQGLDFRNDGVVTSVAQIQIVVEAGWNLISLPLNVSDARVKTLFPNSTMSGAFTYQGSYIVQETLQAGLGYWLKFAAPETISILGEPINEVNLKVRKGWNMVGAPLGSLSTGDLKLDPCVGQIVSYYFAYDPNNGYVQTDTLVAGKGYWVKVSQAGVLFEQEWIKISDIVPAAVAVNPIEPNILYAALSSDFSDNIHGKILKSTDWGTTWDTLVYNVDGGSLTIDPNNSDVVYASLGVANDDTPGIMKTTDAGVTWFHADSGISLNWESGVGWLFVDPNNSQILYTEAGGIATFVQYKSTNGGSNWFPLVQYDSVNCPSDTLCFLFSGAYVAIDPQNSDVLYAVTWSLSTNILFWSTTGGQQWVILNRFPRDSYGAITGIAVNSSDSNTLYLGALGFYQSVDRGQIWQKSSSGLPDSASVRMRLSKSPTIIYSSTGLAIFQSNDAGMNWQLVINDSLPGFIFNALDEKGGFIYVRKDGGLYKFKICRESLAH